MSIEAKYDKQEYVIKVTGSGKRSAIAKSLKAIARSLQDSHSSWSTLEDATLCAEISELEAAQDAAADEIVDRVLQEEPCDQGEAYSWPQTVKDFFTGRPLLISPTLVGKPAGPWLHGVITRRRAYKFWIRINGEVDTKDTELDIDDAIKLRGVSVLTKCDALPPATNLIAPSWQKRLHDVFMDYPSEDNDYSEDGLDKVFDQFGRRGNIVYEPDESCLSYDEQDKLCRLIPRWRTDQTAYMEILELVTDHASVWAGEEPTMYCHECGDTVFYGEGNVLHHEDSMGGIDHERDEDHTPNVDGGE